MLAKIIKKINMSINIASHLWEFNKHCNYHNFDVFLSERFTHRQKNGGVMSHPLKIMNVFIKPNEL